MHWLLLLILLLLLPGDAFACNDCGISNPFVENVTLADPASYKLVYTGIGGLLLDEYVRFVSRKWVDDIERRYNSGDINDTGLNTQIRILNNYRQYYFNNEYADLRSHWWQYQESWGQLPTYTTGPSGDVIDVGPFRVNSNFKFKLKSYEADISNEWSYKFRPVVRVSSKPPFVRVIAMGHQFTYKSHRKKLVRITVAAGYDFFDGEGLVELQFELLSW